MTNDPIKAKIQELCPDVMELKFGCEVKGYWANGIILENLGYSKKLGKDVLVKCRMYQYDKSIDNELVLKTDEILGSPITLAVVLRAIEKRFSTSSSYIEPTQAILRLTMPRYEDGKYLGEGYWNLSKDSYDEQNEETKQFIGSLLGIN